MINVIKQINFKITPNKKSKVQNKNKHIKINNN